MKRLRFLIVGAGGFGREVLQWSRDAGLDQGECVIHGFLDDDPRALDEAGGVGLPITGTIRDYAPREDEMLICGLGLPRAKWTCLRALVERGARFKTVVHPTALVGQNVRLGTGCIICPGVVLTVDIAVGEFVTFNCYSSVGHDGCVGDWSTLSGYASVSGKCKIGKGVFLGSHVAMLPSLSIGDWATVGAGSVAWRSVPPRTTVFGVPARAIWEENEASDNPKSAGPVAPLAE